MTGLAFFRALKFFIVEDFLAADECAHITDDLRNLPTVTAAVLKVMKGIETVDETVRSTRRVEVADDVRRDFTIALNAVRDGAGRHFDVELAETEKPQFLIYRQGDFFTRHTDRDSTGIYRRTVSLIVFLNDDFTGGELRFFGGVQDKPLELTLRPVRGMLVGFRSDWIHEVAPVTSGERFTVVSWFY